MCKGSTFSELAEEVYFTNPVSARELLELLHGVSGLQFPDQVRQRAARLLVDQFNDLKKKDVLMLLQYGSFIDESARERLGRFIAGAVSEGRLSGGNSFEICRAAFDLCGASRPYLNEWLLNSLLKVGKDEPLAQLIGVVHGNEQQRKNAWAQLVTLGPYRTGYEEVVRQIILQSSDEVYIRLAWQYLIQNGRSLFLPNDRVPICIRNEYRYECIRRSATVTDLLDLYPKWPERRSTILEELKERFSATVLTVSQQKACRAAVQEYPELRDTLTPMIIHSVSLDETIVHPELPIPSVDLIVQRLQSEPLSDSVFSALIQRLPQQRSELLSQIAGLRDLNGLKLQARLLKLEELTQIEVASIMTGLTENLANL